MAGQRDEDALRVRSRLALKRSLARGADVATESKVDPVEVERVREALGRLSPMDRDVLLAVRLEDRSYVEIGQTFGLSVVEVEQLFAQALSELLRNPDRPSRRR
jgi:RNA polymerase sigma-70 factor (ECF subfamily)